MALVEGSVFLLSFFLGLHILLPGLVGSLGFVLGVLLDFFHLMTAVFLAFLHVMLGIFVDIGIAVMLIIFSVRLLRISLVLHILLPGNIGTNRFNLFFSGKSGTCKYSG